MRIKYNKPNYNDKRIASTFIWLPKYLDKQIVWLEFVKVEQRYICDILFYQMWTTRYYFINDKKIEGEYNY